MKEMRKTYQDKLKIGAEQSYKNLAMFPLLSGFSTQGNDRPMDESDMISLKCVGWKRTVRDPNRNYQDGCCRSSWHYIEQFARVDRQIGAIFLINGKIAGMVYCDTHQAFENSFISMVECYAKKAVDEFSPKIVLGSLKPEVINYMQSPNNAWIAT